ncbi:MAG: hypothetical protein JO176_10475 [Acidimicrobiia bacterium]|nr:hypothetical protein [Acidimicrobiia bacterium]
MLRRRVSLGAAIWVIVGVVVAAQHHFLDHLSGLSPLLSAVLAILAWPLVVLKVHVAI